ncbi:MAG TPA: ribonuclease D [Gammaproteobacteria bacterium]|nr:ribonuclease D [Gammaproteobacteria bacterium]
MHPHLIQTEAALEKACARWRAEPAIGIDTEFVRERTFYPLPALIQVADAEGVVLIDVPALEDSTPLVEVLAATSPLKVMHAFSEDLEVLAIAAGCEPDAVFDTQLAGAFTGYGFSLGYRGLVEALLGVTLDKGETRSDWLRRPLSAAQLRYAALDAGYLLPMYEKLDAELEDLGRRAWLEEEEKHVRRARERDKKPELAYLKVKDRQRLNPEDHALLRVLAEWREREAMSRDRPRRHVLADSVLVTIAESRPRSVKVLRAVDGISERAVSRYAQAILSRVDSADGNIVSEADARVDLRPHAGTLKRLKRTVKDTAEKLNLPPELLANRRALESLLLAALGDADNPAPPEFLGWRAQVITAALLRCIHESKS